VAANYGAHEVMEVHEVLTCAIDGINSMQMLRQQVRDQRLGQMMDHQLQFAINEYNNMVQMIHQQGMGQATPYRAVKSQSQPVYGLDNPERMTPNLTPNQIDDRDISSIVLGFHKASAGKKMLAALECANPEIRRAMQQGAVNCSEQAYEVWQYMNQSGYYQVPTMKDVTTNTMMEMYETAGNMQQAGMQGMQGMRPGQGMNMQGMNNMQGGMNPTHSMVTPNMLTQ
jgi:spore coat protein CotF